MLNNFVKYGLICLSCLYFLSGCTPSATGPLFKYAGPKNDRSTITHYRVSKGFGASVAIYLYSNNEFVTYITNGGYFQEYLKPGKYNYKKLEKYYVVIVQNLLVDIEPIISLNVAPGEEYFVKWSVKFGGKIEPEIVPKEQALSELADLKRFEFEEKQEEATGKLLKE